MNQVLFLVFLFITFYPPRNADATDQLHTYSLHSVLEETEKINNSVRMCGPLALSRMLHLHDAGVDYRLIRSEFKSVSSDGVQIGEILTIANRHGFECKALALNRFSDLEDLLPAIALVNEGRHCIVLEDLASSVATIWDPAAAKTLKLPVENIEQIWNGEVIVFTKSSTVAQGRAVSFLLGTLAFQIALLLFKASSSYGLAHSSTIQHIAVNRE